MHTQVLVVGMWICSVWYPQLVTSQSCNNGYQLSVNYDCVDTDECEAYGDPTHINILCGAYAVCHNTPGSYYCTCQAGYITPYWATIFTQKTHCREINECIDLPNICGANALCHKTFGSFFCQCKQGFFSNADASAGCSDINECESSPCGLHATCHNTNGGFTCRCDPGFVPNGGKDDTTLTRCKDHNECESSQCGANATCRNTNGSLHCTCDRGFVSSKGIVFFPNMTRCEDVDECEGYGDPTYITSLCGAYTVCHNTPGSYYCTCRDGYVTPSGATNFSRLTNCKDHNECESSPCGPNAACYNTEGSFYCMCDTGFVYSSTNQCEDRNECESSPCGPNVVCYNTEGSFYCTCDPGFVYSSTNQCEESHSKHFDILNILNILNNSQSLSYIVKLGDNIVSRRKQWEQIDRKDRHIAASTFLNTMASSVMATFNASNGRTSETSQNIDIELQAAPENVSLNDLLTLNGRDNTISVYWRTVTAGNQSGRPAVGFIAYRNMESILDGYFGDEENEFLTKYQLNSEVVTITSNMNISETTEHLNMTLKHTRVGIVLHIITEVGIIASLVCLAISILTFLFGQTIQRETRTIHINLSVSLFLAELLFITGISWTRNKIGCAIIAGALHYLFLAAFTWMFLDGLQLFLLVRHLSKVKASRSITAREMGLYAFGYGLPAIIVGISAAVNPGGFGSLQFCWLQLHKGFIWSFLGPVVAIILINTILFIGTLWTLRQKLSGLNSQVSKIKDKRMLAFKAAGQVFVLGCTWILGAFHFQKEMVVMAYLFTIVNSFQGVFIFIFLCVLNKQVREEYRRCFARVNKGVRSSYTMETVSPNMQLTGTSADGSGKQLEN